MENREEIISIERIRKTYEVGTQQVHALAGVDLTIRRNDYVAIMGPSGSGKSTLMNILGCLDTPTSGRYVLNGTDVSHMDEEELAEVRNKEIGFVFQTFNLLPRYTALENVAVPLIYAGVSKSKRLRRAEEALRSVGLGDRMEHKPNEMSGGQRQRVAVARALINDPSIILADEPTGNLDSTTSRQVLYSMLEMAKSYGITFVMVTHEKELAYCGDRIVTIKDGRVLDNVLLGEDEKAENRRRLFGDVTSGDIAEPETTVEEEKKPAAKQAKAVAVAVAEKVNQESM